MEINQHSVGLNVNVAKQGCLFLCYLWAGWLHSAVRVVKAGERLPKWDTDASFINALYQILMRRGTGDRELPAIRQDCYVLRPEHVIRSMLHGTPLETGRITVTKHAGTYRGTHHAPMAAADVVDGHGFIVDVAHWRLGIHHHFTAACCNPWAYYDPWVDSVCAARGELVDVRRVVVSE